MLGISTLFLRAGAASSLQLLSLSEHLFANAKGAATFSLSGVKINNREERRRKINDRY